MDNPQCMQCGEDIAHKRSDAKYCDARCRMRYRRAQKKENLISELVELFLDIPHHSVQNTNEGFRLIGTDAYTRKVQKWTLTELQNMPISQLKELKNRKKAQSVGENLVKLLFKQD